MTKTLNDYKKEYERAYGTREQVINMPASGPEETKKLLKGWDFGWNFIESMTKEILDSVALEERLPVYGEREESNILTGGFNQAVQEQRKLHEEVLE